MTSWLLLNCTIHYDYIKLAFMIISPAALLPTPPPLFPFFLLSHTSTHPIPQFSHSVSLLNFSLPTLIPPTSFCIAKSFQDQFRHWFLWAACPDPPKTTEDGSSIGLRSTCPPFLEPLSYCMCQSICSSAFHGFSDPRLPVVQKQMVLLTASEGQ